MSDQISTAPVTQRCETCPFTSADPDAIEGHQHHAPERGWLGQGEQHTMSPEPGPSDPPDREGSPDSDTRGQDQPAAPAVSPQMVNLLRRYQVENEGQLVRAIREEQRRETGSSFASRSAEALLDQMLEAEYQRIEGGAYDHGEDVGDPAGQPNDDRYPSAEDVPEREWTCANDSANCRLSDDARIRAGHAGGCRIHPYDAAAPRRPAQEGTKPAMPAIIATDTTVTIAGERVPLLFGAHFTLTLAGWDHQLVDVMLDRRAANGDLIFMAPGLPAGSIRIRTSKILGIAGSGVDHPILTRRTDETAAAFVDRAEQELPAPQNAAWIASDAGQAALAAVADELRVSRRLDRKADVKTREIRAAAKRRGVPVSQVQEEAAGEPAIEGVRPPRPMTAKERATSGRPEPIKVRKVAPVQDVTEVSAPTMAAGIERLKKALGSAPTKAKATRAPKPEAVTPPAGQRQCSGLPKYGVAAHLAEVSAFGKHAGTKDGLSNTCRACNQAYPAARAAAEAAAK